MPKKFLILTVFLALLNTSRAVSAIAAPYSEELPRCENTMSIAPMVSEVPTKKIRVQQVNQFDPSPAPTPIATPQPTLAPSDPQSATVHNLAATEHDHLFEKYATEYGIKPSTLSIISKCESGHNPSALSSNQMYGGLFQFSASTWQSNRRAMGLDDDPSLRFNSEEAVKTAAFKISRDGIGAWPTCGKKAQ